MNGWTEEHESGLGFLAAQEWRSAEADRCV